MESSTKEAFIRPLMPLLERAAPRLMPALERGILRTGSRLAPVMKNTIMPGVKNTFRAMAGAEAGSTAPLTARQWTRGILFPKLKGIGPAGSALSAARNFSLAYTAGTTGQKAWDLSGQAVDAVHGLADAAQLNGMPQDQVNRLRSMNRWGLAKSFFSGSPFGRGRENPIAPGQSLSNRRVYDLGMMVLRDRMRASAGSMLKPHEVLSPVSALMSRGIRYGLGEESPIPMKEIGGELARASGLDRAFGNYAQSLVSPYLRPGTASNVGDIATRAVSDPELRARLAQLGTRVGLYGHTDTQP